MRLHHATAVGALTLMLATGCGGGSGDATAERAPSPEASPAPAVHAVTLTFEHEQKPYDGSGVLRENDQEGTGCSIVGLTKDTGSLKYMLEGTDVVLKDAGGVVVAKGSLSAGIATGITPAANTYTCTWKADLSQVPESTFYKVAVGDQEVITLSRDDLAGSGWNTTIAVS